MEVEAEEVEESAVVEAPPVVTNGACSVFIVTQSGSDAEGGEDGGEGGGDSLAKVVAKVVAKGLVLATATFFVMIKQRRTTLLPLRRLRRAWPPPPLLLWSPEK